MVYWLAMERKRIHITKIEAYAAAAIGALAAVGWEARWASLVTVAVFLTVVGACEINLRIGKQKKKLG